MEYRVGERYRVMSEHEALCAGFFRTSLNDSLYYLDSHGMGTLFDDEFHILDSVVKVTRVSTDSRYIFVSRDGSRSVECPKAMLIAITHLDDTFDANDISIII